MLHSQAISFDREIQDSFLVSHFTAKKLVARGPLRLRYNMIYLVVNGVGNLIIDEGHFPLGENQLLLIAKGQIISWKEGTMLDGYEVVFGDCFWEKAPASASNCKAVLFNNAEANQQLHIAPADTTALLPVFRSLHHESESPDYSNKLDALAAYLKIIMIKIGNINASLHLGVDSEEKQLYRRFLELVSEQYKIRHEVAAFADQLYITARRLTEICRHCSGRGAKDIINGQLIAEAKRFLLFSASPVKEIAYLFNFATPEQFSHFFKKHAGISPNDYRRLHVHSDR